MAKIKKLLTNRKGYWTKQIKGKRYYFGKNYEKAVEEYKRQRPYIEIGMAPPGSDDAVLLSDLLDEFLSNRKQRLQEGTLSQRTFDDYEDICDRIAECLPLKCHLVQLKPEHFDKLRSHLKSGKNRDVSAKTHDRRLGYARAVFRFAAIDSRMIERPLPFTQALASVSKRELRKHRAKQPDRIISSAELDMAIKAGTIRMRAMILLAINGGYNNSDIARLPLSLVSSFPNVLEYPRRKTFFQRVTPLWPETIQAIKEWVNVRPDDDRDYLFVSDSGKLFFEFHRNDQISKSFYRLLKRLKVYTLGKNFGALRTTFAEVGKEVGDDVALKALMGHSDGSQLYESYAKGIYLPRLLAITNHVRQWHLNTC